MSSEACQIEDAVPKRAWTPLERVEMKTVKELGQIHRPGGGGMLSSLPLMVAMWSGV